MMAKSDYEAKLERRILHLETKVKHLTNDLWITGEENETATASYLEILLIFILDWLKLSDYFA